MKFACLDIETSWERDITVIGVYRSGEGTTQLVAPDICRERLLALVEDVEFIFTYNGSGFDLPVIEKHLGIPLHTHRHHRDLMFDCRKKKLKGGLKAIEKTLGIHRDTDGLTGLDAMKLWRAHQAGQAEALEILLRYNKEDVVNLHILAHKLGIPGVEPYAN